MIKGQEQSSSNNQEQIKKLFSVQSNLSRRRQYPFYQGMNPIDEVNQANHSRQRGLMEYYETDEGQQLKNMYMRDEVSFMTDDEQLYHQQAQKQQSFKDMIQQNNQRQTTLSIDRYKTSQNSDGEEKSILSSKVVRAHQKIMNKQNSSNKSKSNIFKDQQQQINLVIQSTQQKDQFSYQEQLSKSECTQFQAKGQRKSSLRYLKQKTKLANQPETLQDEKIKARMLNFFRNKTYSGKNYYLDKRSVHLTLNDKSDGYFAIISQIFIIKIAKLLLKKIKNIITHSFLNDIPVLSSQSRLCLFHQIIIVIFNSFFFLLLSILIVFDNVLVNQEVYLYKIALSMWAVDILIRLNTSTYSNSNIITDRKTIFFFYVKKQFLWDIIPSIFLLSFIFYNSSDQTLYSSFSTLLNTKIITQIFCFAKLFNITNDLEDLQRKLCMMMKRYYLMKLANLIIKLFIIGHVLACSWYIIAVVETKYLGEQVTWYNDSIASDLTWWKMYLLSMYWALTLMTTGSNVATTVLQTFFTSFIMLFTTIISGYMLNATGLILCEIDASEENKRNDLNIINDYMREKNISMNLQGRVNFYLEYYYQKNYQKYADDIKNVLSKISTDLRSLLQKEYFFQILTKIDFLHQNFTSTTLQNLSIECEEVVYFPNQVIFEENDFRDAALLVIIEGQVEIYQKVGYNTNEQKTICYLKSGQILGQINFFTGMARSACAKSKGFTKLAKISQETFLSVIKDNQKDLQTFYQMKDNISLYEDYEEMNIKCSACQSFKHLQGSCHLVHLNKQVAKEKVRLQNIIKQIRKLHSRLKTSKLNSLKNQKRIKDQYYEFQNNNEDSIEAMRLKFYDDFQEEVDEDEEEEQEDQIDKDETVSQSKLKSDLNNTFDLVMDSPPQNKYKSIPDNDDFDHQKSKNNSAQSTVQFKEGYLSMPSTGIMQASFVANETENQKKNQKNHINNQSNVSLNMIDIQNYEITHLAHIIESKKKKYNLIYSQLETSKPQKSRESYVTYKSNKFTQQNSGYQKQISESGSDEEKNNPKFKQNSKNNLSLNQGRKKKQSQIKKENQKNNEVQTIDKNNKKISATFLDSMKKDIDEQYDNSLDAKERFLWQFDKQKDYDFYFNHGNIIIRLHQFKMFQKMKEKAILKQILLKSRHVRKKTKKFAQNQSQIDLNPISPSKRQMKLQ